MDENESRQPVSQPLGLPDDLVLFSGEISIFLGSREYGL